MLKQDVKNFKLDRSSPKQKNKNVTGLKKDKLGKQIMKRIFRLRTKTCNYLKDNSDKDKKA